MDVAGARILRRRLDESQRRHWLSAAAVREGHQEGHDPDAEALVGYGPQVRMYEARQGHCFRKELVDGRWRRVTP
jgi:hypothetical protein